MWYVDSNNEDVNVVSARLVHEVLRLDIQQTDDDAALAMGGNILEVRGHVDLQWSLYSPDRSSQPTHHTRFKVTAVYDPPFDIVVGRSLAVECGLAGH